MLGVTSVAFQGEPGAYSEQAVAALVPGAEAEPVPSVHKVFEAVEIGTVDWGVVPLENSHAGSINETYDLLVRHGLKIVAETIVRISHCLLAHQGTSLKDVTQVLSHPQALQQCTEFLDSLEVEKVAVTDTAGAARQVADSRPGKAAIASKRAAEMYGLEVLAEAIEDRADNSTKFVAIGMGADERFGPPTKTSIVFATADVPGSLYRCLEAFARHEVNLTKIESRPSRAKAWQYHFYLDLEAPADDPGAQAALIELTEHTSFLRVLGSYPAAPSRPTDNGP